MRTQVYVKLDFKSGYGVDSIYSLVFDVCVSQYKTEDLLLMSLNSCLAFIADV